MERRKVITTETLKKTIDSLRKKGRKIVFTNGCFDILHKGHILLLKKAKTFGDILIVGLNSDLSVKKIKGRSRPVNPACDRAEVLGALECVDYITIFDEPTPRNVIKKVMPDILVKGGDWKKEEIVGKEIVESRGGKVYTIPLVKGYSTSRIIARINKDRHE